MASSRQISIGGVKIGGGAAVVVQSMTNTRARDVEKTMAQIDALALAGCEIVRCAVPGIPDAEALPEIVRRSKLPLIADIHFNSSLALKAIAGGPKRRWAWRRVPTSVRHRSRPALRRCA